MPRDGSNVWSPPVGTTAIFGETISDSAYNNFVSDLTTLANETRPISAGGTGASTPSVALANLGAVPASPSITSIAAQNINVDQILYGSAPNTYSTTSLTPFGRSLLDDADATEARTTLSAQTANQNLTDISAVTPSAATILVGNGANLVALPPGGVGQVLTVDTGAPSGLAYRSGSAVLEIPNPVVSIGNIYRHALVPSSWRRIEYFFYEINTDISGDIIIDLETTTFASVGKFINSAGAVSDNSNPTAIRLPAITGNSLSGKITFRKMGSFVVGEYQFLRTDNALLSGTFAGPDGGLDVQLKMQMPPGAVRTLTEFIGTYGV